MPRKLFAHQVYRHKVVLITGGCSGIGRALVLRFAQAGAHLVILDLDQSALDSLVQHLHGHLNVEALGLRCDITDAEAVRRSVNLAVERFGGIDVLVNNAGITHRSLFADTDLAVFQRVMAVNFYGALHCTQAVLPSLLARRGQIVVLSSLTGFAPLLYRSAYNASKHALHGLFDTLRMEIDGSGVAVMLACPGFTATDLRKNALVGDGSVIRQPALVLGAEVASPRDVAEAIYQGAARRRRLLVLSNVNWQARILARFFPRLFEKLLVPKMSGLKPGH
ncbi:SDR family oxidoreductase [Pseudomonas sp. ZM23]|uniref:SDR family oxidoreductase n=1 Tax=Pseudomonas triclosanedens TaxID=2961893 RepID=A0ABY7A0C3_9PSED|nr:SDR family oxidoreductase [Pseudomonas triclosanedens]MCP8464045.1 SDR family oxidoreductase [Pseudomonas triclosanedens]MCP8469129.1 SDR family oxidoreductase [Pseudomonas triclosanedens]MCP8475851.1 SDR family oxidoreductase [Pseudomonas triclosanedens]WAI50446.1 SDR family oxidoreductase [Pseudomonas triclosanedens]